MELTNEQIMTELVRCQIKLNDLMHRGSELESRLDYLEFEFNAILLSVEISKYLCMMGIDSQGREIMDKVIEYIRELGIYSKYDKGMGVKGMLGWKAMRYAKDFS